MPELSTETLPLLPLTSGVVLPGMVVTATLETPESRSASSAAGDTGGHLLLVPKVDGRYATVGTVAKIENAGELPNGHAAAWSCAACTGPASAPASPAPATALWVEVEPVDDPPADRARHASWPASTGPWSRTSSRPAAPPQHRRAAAGHDRPRRTSPTPPATPPTCPSSRRSRCWRRSTSRQRLEKVAGLGPGHPGRGRRSRTASARTSPRAWRRRQREFILRQQLAAIRKELGEGEDGESPVDDLPGQARRRQAARRRA